MTDILNNWFDLFGGAGWVSYSNPESLGAKLENIIGVRHGNIGKSSKSFSVKFLISHVEVVLSAKIIRGKVSVSSNVIYPCNGFVFQNVVIPVVSPKVVPNADKDIKKALLDTLKETKKALKPILKEVGAIAKRNTEAKSLYMMTI